MNSQFHEKIVQLQTDYYKNNNKNMFFKSSQKLDCAATITGAMDIRSLFEHAIYILPNTNRIYFDYPFFKTFATPAIFESLVTYIYELINQTMQIYSQYEIHVNWQSYSVSAHDRYKDLYRIFLARYENSGFNFHDNLSRNNPKFRFFNRFELIVTEINSLKDIVMKLQSYTMEVNKMLVDERIHILSDLGNNSVTSSNAGSRVRASSPNSVDLKKMVEQELNNAH